MSWMQKAACRDLGPNLFFPERGEPTTKAKKVCKTCPVTEECLAYGIAERMGIWGGTSEAERRRMFRGKKRPSKRIHHGIWESFRKCQASNNGEACRYCQHAWDRFKECG